MAQKTGATWRRGHVTAPRSGGVEEGFWKEALLRQNLEGRIGICQVKDGVTSCKNLSADGVSGKRTHGVQVNQFFSSLGMTLPFRGIFGNAWKVFIPA